MQSSLHFNIRKIELHCAIDSRQPLKLRLFLLLHKCANKKVNNSPCNQNPDKKDAMWNMCVYFSMEKRLKIIVIPTNGP